MTDYSSVRIRAKKRFGQNFLIDPHKAKMLVEALEIERRDHIIEVGPGKGVLTERLANYDISLTLVEIDRELVELLLQKFGNRDNIVMRQMDIIKYDPIKDGAKRVKIIGNLPYNISGAMIEWLIKYYYLIQLAVITVQKEVADRIRALPASRVYGSMSVMIQAFYDVQRLTNLPPGCFSPRPKVDSVALKLIPNRKIPSKFKAANGTEMKNEFNIDDFMSFVRACFSQKRKTLLNSLGSFFQTDRQVIQEKIESIGLRKDIRAEQLGLNDFLNLWRLIPGDADEP